MFRRIRRPSQASPGSHLPSPTLPGLLGLLTFGALLVAFTADGQEPPTTSEPPAATGTASAPAAPAPTAPAEAEPAGAAGADSDPAAEDPVYEAIEVREEEVLVGLLPAQSRLRLDVEDLMVRVGGEMRTAVKISPLEDGEAVTVAYFDLSGRDLEPVAIAALSLADRAEVLARMGTVEVVVADPEPRTVQPPTRDPDLVVQGLALAAGLARRLGGPLFAGPGDPDEGLAWERLRTWAEERDRGGPRFLFATVEPFPPRPEEVAALQEGTEAAPTLRTRRLRDCARTLAAAGWVTVHLSMREGELRRYVPDPIIVRAGPDPDDFAYALNLGYALRWAWQKMRGRSAKRPVDDPRTYDAATSLEEMPLVAVVRETGGELVAWDTALDETLDELRDRMRVWFPVPARRAAGDGPEEGLLPLEVVHLPDGRTLRSRRWTIPPRESGEEGGSGGEAGKGDDAAPETAPGS